jgi:hypothetical protein
MPEGDASERHSARIYGRTQACGPGVLAGWCELQVGFAYSASIRSHSFPTTDEQLFLDPRKTASYFLQMDAGQNRYASDKELADISASTVKVAEARKRKRRGRGKL